jgi:hypothetical protein
VGELVISAGDGRIFSSELGCFQFEFASPNVGPLWDEKLEFLPYFATRNCSFG